VPTKGIFYDELNHQANHNFRSRHLGGFLSARLDESNVGSSAFNLPFQQVELVKIVKMGHLRVAKVVASVIR
jgi:hypothetical protein